MILLPKDSKDDDIIEFVQDFIDLLAEEKYVEAMELTYPHFERKWTPDLVKQLIESYSQDNDDSPLYLTPIRRMNNAKSKFDIFWLETRSKKKPPVLGGIEIDLPFNGEWSDLTAIFDIYELESGIALSLFDIHIL